ncbi:hypothetical protein B7R21_07655 [Subtercola boreus]|uniref:DUF6036 domain-containing protein n=1 Tax=Subtercola boreus TaxID=120213 RepID=A0A3E0VW50_9MICO|nr:DUF6036 family nucleotidyltransferase [Subtercola boreus]RFA13815.1 hypothetical protein B7R21_07655 [Subtercola boreus]
MNDEQVLFSRDELLELLTELGRRLDARGVTAEAYIIGGTAMAIGLGSSRRTGDIDGWFKPMKEVLEEVRTMAVERGLATDWLNTHASGFMSFSPKDDTGAQSITLKGMRIRLASPRFLLAMKLAAGRAKDAADISKLVNELGISDADELVDLAFDVLGEDGVTLTDSRESLTFQARDAIAAAARERSQGT